MGRLSPQRDTGVGARRMEGARPWHGPHGHSMQSVLIPVHRSCAHLDGEVHPRAGGHGARNSIAQRVQNSLDAQKGPGWLGRVGQVRWHHRSHLSKASCIFNHCPRRDKQHHTACLQPRLQVAVAPVAVQRVKVQRVAPAAKGAAVVHADVEGEREALGGGVLWRRLDTRFGGRVRSQACSGAPFRGHVLWAQL